MKVKPSTKQKKQIGLFSKAILWLSIILSLCLLGSYLAAVTDPRHYWFIAFLGLAYPYLLVANLAVLLYWLLARSRYACLPALTIVIGWNVLCNNFGFRLLSETTAYPRQQQLRVMTYNAHNFKMYGANNDASTRHQILTLIAEQQPDIIGFQEYYTRRRGRYNMTDSIKKLMRSSHYYFKPFGFDTADEAEGLAVFSKYPIVNKGCIYLTEDHGSENQCLFVDVTRNNQTIRIYSVHLQSISFDPEDYNYLTQVSNTGKPSLTSSKRIGGKLKRAFMKRSEQVFKVKAHAAQCPYPYIIAGDFNDTPASFAVNQMAKGLKNAFREKGSGLGRTYNGSFPNYQIDYIMASPKMEVANYWIVEKKLSDHYPVCSDLRVR